MKVLCIKNKAVEARLSEGVTYSAEQHKTGYRVADNNGHTGYFAGHRFINSEGHLCHDCGFNTLETNKDYYMVHDVLWHVFGLGKQPGMLCIACFEERMGMPMHAGFLTLAPVNTIGNAFTRALLKTANLLPEDLLDPVYDRNHP